MKTSFGLRSGHGLTLLAALGVAVLAFVSPIDDGRSDPGVALLAAQGLLDNGTFALDPYRDHPSLAYQLEGDYRIRNRNGQHVYYALGTPLLSLPFVWLANRFGYDMLQQADELALQNLLSALVCGLIFILLYRIARAYLAPGAALVVSLVTTLGSSLVSTLGTGLWNAGYALLFILFALLHLIQVEQGDIPKPRAIVLIPTLGLAFLCRPTAGFFVLGVATYLLLGRPKPRRDGLLLAAVGLGGALFLNLLAAWGWIPSYYSMARLVPQTPLLRGLQGHLISPSRGLLTFSPFLLPVLVAAIWTFHRLRRERLFWLTAVWGSTHLLTVALKGNWWGGHSYGPRLMAEVVPALMLITLLAWHHLPRSSHPRATRLLVTAYLLLGVVAVAVHSGQGLFNPATRAWNYEPDIDTHPANLFSWRYPQLTATAAAIEARGEEIQRQRLTNYVVGTTLGPQSRAGIFRHWHPPEGTWRWARDRTPSVSLVLPRLPPTFYYVLALNWSALGSQTVKLSLNGQSLGNSVVASTSPQAVRFPVASTLLKAEQENTLRFVIKGEAVHSGDDPRPLRLALHSLAFHPLPVPTDGIGFGDDAYFMAGFSPAEESRRWTDGPVAQILYPLPPDEAPGTQMLRLEAGALGRQRVEVWFNGVKIAAWETEGLEPRIGTVTFRGDLLHDDRPNEIELRLPDAYSPEGDPRQLGLAVQSVRLGPLEK